jgi:hypothetical protein
MIQHETGFFTLSDTQQIVIGQAVGWAVEALFEGP